jgi:hypothetical protein
MDEDLLEICRAVCRQCSQAGAFDGDGFGAVRIMAAENIIDEAPVGRKVLELPAAAQQQCILNGLLEMTVRTLDRTILMGNASVIATVSRLRKAAERLSVRWRVGTPPRVNKAFCKPSARAVKLSPPSITWPCWKPEFGIRKW